MKDQFVIACIDRPEDAATVLPWAEALASRLRHKSLMVLNVSHEGNAPWLKHIGHPYVGLRGEWSTAIEGLPTAFNGILAVTAVDRTAPRHVLANPRTLLQQFRKCKTAYIAVPVGVPFCTDRTALTLTHRREGKEKLVWASYLARFAGAALTIAHPDYSDRGLRQRFLNNMQFVKKMYTPLEIDWLDALLSRNTNVDACALDELHPDLLVAMTTDTRERDLFDLFAPRPELRLLTRQQPTPILFLNPRDDLYILCD